MASSNALAFFSLLRHRPGIKALAQNDLNGRGSAPLKRKIPFKRAEFSRIAPDVVLGRGAQVHSFTNLYGCKIGEETRVGCFVEIQRGAAIGNRCKISSHTFICEGVTIEDECFIGHHVVFVNDRMPSAVNADGSLQSDADWKCIPTLVRRRASIGSGAVILCGVTIGEGAVVGAGAVVTRNVPARAVVAGNPARVLRKVKHRGLKR